MGALTNGGCRMFYTRPSDGKTYCFEPVPLMGESKEFLRTDAGHELAIIHELSFEGTLLPTMPSLSGVPDESTCISLLARKRQQMCEALSEDRGDLLIIDASGYPIVSAKPIVTELDFEQGRIVQQSPYSLDFQYEEIPNSGFPVIDYGEDWDFQHNDDDTISVTHNISAVGIKDLDLNKEAHEVAKDFVIQRIGMDKTKSFVLKSPIAPTLIDVDNFGIFNRRFSESVGETDGSYEVSETFTLSSGNYIDDRSYNEEFSLDDTGALVKSITIDGTVQGFGETSFERIENAINGFNSFVAGQIGFSDVSGINSKSKSINRIAGTVTYSIELIPESGGSDNLENRSINRSFEVNENGSVQQTVSTSAQVRQSSASGIDLAIDYCFANNYPIDSVDPPFDASLSGNILSRSTSRDENQKSFSLTRVFVDQLTSGYTEDWNVDLQEGIDTSQVSVTINGTIQGVGIESTTKSTDRFLSASGAWVNTIEPLIPSRIATIMPTGSCVLDEATSKSLGYNQLNGVITYNQTFTTRVKTSNENVKQEQIQVSWDRPADVIAEFTIPGKADGPVLQDIETLTGWSKQLTINYTMASVSGVCGNNIIGANQALTIALAESNILVDNTPAMNARGEKPNSSFVKKTRDTVGFDKTNYKFTRNVTWKYL